MSRIITIAYNEICPIGYLEVNCTSRSTTIYRALSPFMPFNLQLYDGLTAKNVENAWQFSKVYQQHDDNGIPNKAWYDWRDKGFNDNHAHRYPMGKNKPLYTFYDNRKLSYVEARKKVYFPLYIQSMINNPVFLELKSLFDDGVSKIAIRDFDVYRLNKTTLADAVDNPYKKAGHGFVLYHMLTGVPYDYE